MLATASIKLFARSSGGFFQDLQECRRFRIQNPCFRRSRSALHRDQIDDALELIFKTDGNLNARRDLRRGE
jgi:hypothetical protein